MESLEQLHDRLRAAASRVYIGRHYRHYKGGEYVVTGLALDEATLDVVVVYRPYYGEYDISFTRPLPAWEALVEWEGGSVPRFQLIEK